MLVLTMHEVSMITSVFEHGAPYWLPDGWPVHRLALDFPDGIPVQGNHVAAKHMKRGIRDAGQSYIDDCRLLVAIAAATEPSRPTSMYADTPMFVEIIATLPRSKTGPTSKGVSQHVSVGGAGRGDGDKITRFVWDALNAKAAGGPSWYDDDCRIAQWQGLRKWSPVGTPPRLELALVPLQRPT